MLVLTTSQFLWGQDTFKLKGTISFVTSNNVYVKFATTELINVGDTLVITDFMKPCLLVNKKSSNSVVCTVISECEFKKEDLVYFIVKPKATVVTQAKDSLTQLIPVKEEKIIKSPSLYSEKIRGNVSVASYSTLSSIRDDRHRMASRFSLDAEHIDNSKFSFESYANYRQDFLNEKSNADQKNGTFRLYNLSLKFDADPSLSFTLGRKINPKTSSLGAVDGLQVEKYFGNNFVGVITGFRPDFYDYNFNSNLLEYGAYFGRKTDSKKFYSETTLGTLEQRNNGEVDRRYAYFQHSSTIFKKIRFFTSLDLDLYDKINNVASTKLRLTNLFTSLNFRFNKDYNATLSYDSRKRILYYETFQTDIERLLNDDIARQGVRIRINGRLKENLFTGISYSKRFQSDQQNKSDNIYMHLSLSELPAIDGRLVLTYNINNSNYLNSNILSLRHSREFFKNKLNAEFYYRFINYTYFNSNNALSNSSFSQSYYGTNLSYHLTRRLTLSISGELSSSPLENNYRIYTRIIKRFYSHKKK